MPSVSLVGTTKIQTVITKGLKLVSCSVIVREPSVEVVSGMDVSQVISQ